MGFYLYRKDSFKKLGSGRNNTVIILESSKEVQECYRVDAIRVSELNIDGVGSALIEQCKFEVVRFYNTQYHDYGWEQKKMDVSYSVIAYNKLEELMLSSEWIVSDYRPGDEDFPIRMQMGEFVTATKIE